MSHIELGSPFPRTHPMPYEEHSFQFASRQYLSNVPSCVPAHSFLEVIERRQTRREFKTLPVDLLSALLFYSSKTTGAVRESDGALWQHRPSPSAGGRHPVDLFVFTRAHKPTLALYDPLSHSLGYLDIDGRSLELLNTQINIVIASIDVTAVWFGAQFGRTSAKYENADSLVWRDAGCLLATIGLVAEALELSFCPIGITGEPWFSQALQCGDKVIGVGGCLVGMRNPP